MLATARVDISGQPTAQIGNPIRIYTVAFGDFYLGMLDSLVKSVRRNAPEHLLTTTWGLRPRQPESYKWVAPFLWSNDYKMNLWDDAMQRFPDGEQVVFVDSDILILRPLDDAFDLEFDVGYTVREGTPPFNSGVIFVRVNERSRKFFREWRIANNKLIAKGADITEYVRECVGANQTAFRYVMDSIAMGDAKKWADPPKMVAFPCSIWNCEQMSYKYFDRDQTRVLHVKSQLREYLLNDAPEHILKPADRSLISLCREYGY